MTIRNGYKYIFTLKESSVFPVKDLCYMLHADIYGTVMKRFIDLKIKAAHVVVVVIVVSEL